jgi:hypothetical protein
MPEPIDHERLVGFGEASKESGITREHESKFVLGITLPRGWITNKTTGVGVERLETLDQTFKQLMAEEIQHMGRVTLHKVVLRYTMSASGQAVAAVVTAAYANVAGGFMARPGAVQFVSNSLTYGHTQEIELVVPDLYTRQVQPDSANAPMPKLYMQWRGDFDVSLLIYYDCDGPVLSFKTLNTVVSGATNE